MRRKNCADSIWLLHRKSEAMQSNESETKFVYIHKAMKAAFQSCRLCAEDSQQWQPDHRELTFRALRSCTAA
jgi:hypothetical protein